MNAVLSEREKYEAMWKFSQYRAVAPGERSAKLFMDVVKPRVGSFVTDFGAGTGRGALMLAVLGGVRVKMLDFASNCLDPPVHEMLAEHPEILKFEQHDLTQPYAKKSEYGYCTDVMEHIPPEQVNKVIENILMTAQHVFFQIDCEPDVCGKLIGQPLHLSVHPHAWWLTKFQEFGAVVHWSKDYGTYACFYLTAWPTGQDVVDVGALNNEEQQLRDNVAANFANGWAEVQPHITNDIEVIILGGGPTMHGQLETIRTLRAGGAKLITLNGAYNWALQHDLDPSAQIVVDSRPFNARFTRPVHPTCKYLIASQCDPGVFEGLPKERTLMWHTSMDTIRSLVEEKSNHYVVPGGSTVLLRAIPLLRMLGFKSYHLFGCDSCLTEDAHHAYVQSENDGNPVIDTIVGGRVFKCHTWMISQAHEFMDLIKFLGEEIDIEIYGDGLLAHILQTGATLSDEADNAVLI